MLFSICQVSSEYRKIRFIYVSFTLQIRVVDRNCEIPHEGPFCDLMWSDPEDIETWAVSPRGAGWLFGSRVTSEVRVKVVPIKRVSANIYIFTVFFFKNFSLTILTNLIWFVEPTNLCKKVWSTCFKTKDLLLWVTYVLLVKFVTENISVSANIIYCFLIFAGLVCAKLLLQMWKCCLDT